MSDKVKLIMIILLSIFLLGIIVYLVLGFFIIREDSQVVVVEKQHEDLNKELDNNVLREKIVKLNEIAQAEFDQKKVYFDLYENKDFANKINEIKELSDDLLFYTNISEDGLSYCATLVYDNENYLCVDNSSNKVFEVDNCLEEVACAKVVEDNIAEEEVILEEIIEEEIDLAKGLIIPDEIPEDIKEEELIIPDEIPEDVEQEELVITTGEITIGKNIFQEKYIGLDKYIVINNKELGPYAQMFFEYDDNNNYGILCEYKGDWYLNFNGDVKKVQELNKDNIIVQDFYLENGDYIYSYEKDGQIIKNK